MGEMEWLRVPKHSNGWFCVMCNHLHRGEKPTGGCVTCAEIKALKDLVADMERAQKPLHTEAWFAVMGTKKDAWK